MATRPSIRWGGAQIRLARVRQKVQPHGMQGLGHGERLWRAEVVLRVLARDAARNQRELLDAVAAGLTALDVEDVPGVPDLAQTSSYDIQPPPPDAGVGVACWVLADNVGDAAETAWRLVESVARAFASEASLWDLRLILREAILSAPVTGTPLTR